MVQMDDGTWRIYIDKYTNGGIWTATSRPQHLVGPEPVTCLGLPARHGRAGDVQDRGSVALHRVDTGALGGDGRPHARPRSHRRVPGARAY